MDWSSQETLDTLYIEYTSQKKEIFDFCRNGKDQMESNLMRTSEDYAQLAKKMAAWKLE